MVGDLLYQSSKKLRNLRARVGCFNLVSAFCSIWRIRSRVTPMYSPTSSRVLVLFVLIPKR